MHYLEHTCRCLYKQFITCMQSAAIMHIVYNSFFFAKHPNDIPFDNVLLAAYETGFFLGFPTTTSINKIGILNFIKNFKKYLLIIEINQLRHNLKVSVIHTSVCILYWIYVRLWFNTNAILSNSTFIQDLTKARNPY